MELNIGVPDENVKPQPWTTEPIIKEFFFRSGDALVPVLPHVHIPRERGHSCPRN